MRRFVIAAAALAASLAAAPASAALVSSYGLLTAGDVTLSSQFINGSALVGGNFTANSSTVGAGLGAAANGRAVLLVAGDFKYDNSVMPHGGVIYGGVNRSDVGAHYSNQVQTPNGTVVQGALPVDLAAAWGSARGTSLGLTGFAATGGFEVLNNNGIGRLTGLAAGANMFNLTTQDLSSVYRLQFVGAADATTSVVINIAGSRFDHHLSFDFGGVSADRVLLNFADATSVRLGGWDLPASVLAPNATVYHDGGTIQGGVVANSFVGGGSSRIMGLGIDSQMAAVPEPASWALMIGGFGLVGGTLRRRRGPVAIAA